MKTAATNAQIAALQTEAAAHGDDAMVRICDLALAGDTEARAAAARSMVGVVYVALVGDDGQRPVVWGVGCGGDEDSAREAAEADAAEWIDADMAVANLTATTITAAQARRIAAGEVSCEHLGIQA